MKKITSLFILLFTVFIAKANQTEDLQKAKFVEFLKDLHFSVLFPIAVSLIMSVWLIIIEKRLKKKGVNASDYPDIFTRFILMMIILISFFIYLVLVGIIFSQNNSGFLSFLKIFFLLFSTSFFIYYGVCITSPFRKIKWSPLKILKVFLATQILFFILNLF